MVNDIRAVMFLVIFHFFSFHYSLSLSVTLFLSLWWSVWSCTWTPVKALSLSWPRALIDLIGWRGCDGRSDFVQYLPSVGFSSLGGKRMKSDWKRCVRSTVKGKLYSSLSVQLFLTSTSSWSQHKLAALFKRQVKKKKNLSHLFLIQTRFSHSKSFMFWLKWGIYPSASRVSDLALF